MRYQRVYEILQTDHLLARKLSEPSIAICRLDQSHKLFPKEVVQITEEIHQRDIDSYTCEKLDIIKFAHDFLVKTKSTPEPKPVPLKTMKTMDQKPIAAILQEHISQTEAHIGQIEAVIKSLNQELEPLKTELQSCHVALKALKTACSSANPPPPPAPKPKAVPTPTIPTPTIPKPKVVPIKAVSAAPVAVAGSAAGYATGSATVSAAPSAGPGAGPSKQNHPVKQHKVDKDIENFEHFVEGLITPRKTSS